MYNADWKFSKGTDRMLFNLVLFWPLSLIIFGQSKL